MWIGNQDDVRWSTSEWEIVSEETQMGACDVFRDGMLFGRVIERLDGYQPRKVVAGTFGPVLPFRQSALDWLYENS